MTIMLKLKFIFSIKINSKNKVYSKRKLVMHINITSVKNDVAES